MLRCSALIVTAAGLLSLSGCGLGSGRSGASLEPHAGLAENAVLAAASNVAGARPPGGGILDDVGDPRRDHGDGPGYADLVRVAFADSDAGLAVTITLAGVVPARLARGEMEDVGVEVFRISPLDTILRREDSDFQVRLDGGAYGWRAFLRTRDGYVDFPGTFTVSGRTLRVVLPWEAVGGPERAEVDAFVDWSSGVGRLATDGVPRVPLVPER